MQSKLYVESSLTLASGSRRQAARHEHSHGDDDDGDDDDFVLILDTTYLRITNCKGGRKRIMHIWEGVILILIASTVKRTECG